MKNIKKKNLPKFNCHKFTKEKKKTTVGIFEKSGNIVSKDTQEIASSNDSRDGNIY
jgi:hypothetical protein